MEVDTLMDLPVEQKMPLQEIQNQQDDYENNDENYQNNHNNINTQVNHSQDIIQLCPLKEKNIYNQEILSDKNSNSKQQSPKYTLSDQDNKENIYTQQCISNKENANGKEKDITLVLKDSLKSNISSQNSASPSAKKVQTLKSSPTDKEDKENFQHTIKPVSQILQQQQINDDNISYLNESAQNESSHKQQELIQISERIKNEEQNQKNVKDEIENYPIQRPSLYEQKEQNSVQIDDNNNESLQKEQMQLKEKQQLLEEEQKRKQEEYEKQQQQLQYLQEQKALLQQQQQQQQQQKAKKNPKFPEGTTVTDLVTINQSNINYGIVIPGNILEETFEIKNKTQQGLVVKMTVICTNEELDDHDEYVYSVRKTVAYEYNEKFVVLIPPSKSQTFKVALKVPNLQTDCEVHGYASVQIQGVEDFFECPIKSFVQIPKIICTKSLYSQSLKCQVIKVAIKRGKKLDTKIPLKSSYGGSLNLDFSWLQFQDQNPENDPYNLMIHPSQVQVQPNGTFMVNLLLKHNQNYKGNQDVYGQNHILKKVLLAKIKNSSLILDFPIMMEIF